MKTPRFWIAVLVAGIVCNVLDVVVQANLFTSLYYSKMDSVRQGVSPGWFVFGDFVAVFVLAWVFDKVASAFGPGVKGGVCAGFSLGVLVNFPTWHLVMLMFKDVSYGMVWANTIFGVVWYMIAGAILAALMKKAAPAASPAV